MTRQAHWRKRPRTHVAASPRHFAGADRRRDPGRAAAFSQSARGSRSARCPTWESELRSAFLAASGAGINDWQVPVGRRGLRYRGMYAGGAYRRRALGLCHGARWFFARRPAALAKVAPHRQVPQVAVASVGLLALLVLLLNIRHPQIVALLTSVAVIWANLSHLLVTGLQSLAATSEPKSTREQRVRGLVWAAPVCR